MAAAGEAFLKRAISIFPQSFSYAFAYGSGVVKQSHHKITKATMTDFIFVVNNSLKWHTENLAKNRRHYSLLRVGGPETIAKFQENLVARIYFNTLVPFEDGLLKYGVISTHHLINDLLDWETLYVSGRLHKPVKVLQDARSSDLRNALETNIRSAVHTSLLLLPETFTERQLYATLAGLSYAGDMRMLFGEDSKKVMNIVDGQFEQFRELYVPILDSLHELVHWNKESKSFEQDTSPTANIHHINLLPRRVQLHLVGDWNRDGRNRDLEDVIGYMANDVFSEEYINTALKRIVWKSSWKQMFKGILTAGLTKSVRYGLSKIGKMIKSKLRRPKVA